MYIYQTRHGPSQLEPFDHSQGKLSLAILMKMKVSVLIFFIAAIYQQVLGQSCTPENCVPPACRCASTQAPGNLPLSDVPQFVFLSFDGAITPATIDDYTSLFENEYTPHGCPITFTFFAYHEYNDYNLTHKLFFKGHEIASHSISHSSPADNWKSKSVKEWEDEIDGMRTILAKFANINRNSIKGMRAPYLQTSGNFTLQAVKNLNMYDASYPTVTKKDPPIWPYTLDLGFQHDCVSPPCPTGSYQGVWTVPMITLTDFKQQNTPCAMVDGCTLPTSKSEALNFLYDNFNRHYKTNKAPFGLYMTGNKWFSSASYLLDAYREFIQNVTQQPDVFVVSISKGLDWMKNPVKVSDIGSVLSCPPASPTTCIPRSCFFSEDDGTERFMKSCVQCPDVYPWVGNPLGIYQ